MDYPLAQENWNAAGKPFYECNYLWFRNSAGGTFGFSDRRRNEIVGVQNIEDGSTVERNYQGGAHILSLPEITRTQGLTSQQHQIVLSGASSDVLNMVLGSNMTRAAMEWHKGQIDTNTGLLIARPVCELFGLVDEISDTIGALAREVSAEWAVTLTVIPHHAELEYHNPAMRSYEAGLERDGDEIFLYVDSVADWNIGWGKVLHRHKVGGDDKPNKANTQSNPNVRTN